MLGLRVWFAKDSQVGIPNHVEHDAKAGAANWARRVGKMPGELAGTGAIPSLGGASELFAVEQDDGEADVRGQGIP